MNLARMTAAALALLACNQGGGSPHHPDTCEEWCAVRAPKEANEGFCDVDGWSDPARGCIEMCQDLAQSEPHELLEECIEENALCFGSMEQCIENQARLVNCTRWCDYRATEHDKDGFCEPTLEGLHDIDCKSVCMRGLSDELPLPSVEDCIRNNALCFIDLSACADS